MIFKLFQILIGVILCTEAFSANYDFSYSGRLVDNTGKPYEGPVAIKASFFHTDVGSTPILEVTTGLTQVPLSEGVFQIKLSLSDSDFQKVFPIVSQSVYIQITNLTHAPTQPYDRQQLTILPYAGKIPVDPTQFNWDSSGQLRFTASSSADFTSAGPIGTIVPNTAVFTTVSTNRTSTATNGSVVNVTIAPTYNQSASTAANTDLLINRTQTSVGSGTQRLIDGQVGGTSRFNVSNLGDGYFAGNVGIGTTSPGTLLDVAGAGTFSSLVVSSSTGLSSPSGTNRFSFDTAGATRTFSPDGTFYLIRSNSGVPAQISISAGGAMNLTSTGTNQSITVTPRIDSWHHNTRKQVSPFGRRSQNRRFEFSRRKSSNHRPNRH